MEDNKISAEIKIINIAPNGDHKHMAKPHITMQIQPTQKAARLICGVGCKEVKLEIKKQYQDLHTPGKNVADWILIQQIEKDICLLFHQLSEYSFIMGDLYYGDVYSLPYWEYLALDGLDEYQRNFITEGCLVMILAMCWDEIDGSGSYISSYLSQCKKTVSKLIPYDENSDKLIRTVLFALQLVEDGRNESDELTELSSWVHKEFVRGYFIKTAQDFKNNPYFNE